MFISFALKVVVVVKERCMTFWFSSDSISYDEQSDHTYVLNDYPGSRNAGQSVLHNSSIYDVNKSSLECYLLL